MELCQVYVFSPVIILHKSTLLDFVIIIILICTLSASYHPVYGELNIQHYAIMFIWHLTAKLFGWSIEFVFFIDYVFSFYFSAITGFDVLVVQPTSTAEPSKMEEKSVERNIIFTAETHNFPTG